MKKNEQIDYGKTCPICGSQSISIIYNFSNFSVLNCKNCLNAWRSNMYDKKRIEEIYCLDDYEENPYFSYDLNSVMNMGNNRFRNYRKALDFLKDIGVHGRLLDIGCGTGTFLALAKTYGWDLTGIEISEDLSKRCSQNVPGAEIINERFEDADLPAGEFALISMWDVIEHVIDPVGVIRRIRTLLADGGVALFCTPDEDSFLAKLGKALYRANVDGPALALHPPNHTYFFSRNGFKYMMEDLDMEVLRSYSQGAFFEHSEMASKIQKIGISMIEKIGSIADARYEMVVMAKK